MKWDLGFGAPWRADDVSRRPYPGVTWGLTHHMGVIDERTLYQTLPAAVTYRDSHDPAPLINNYLVTIGCLRGMSERIRASRTHGGITSRSSVS